VPDIPFVPENKLVAYADGFLPPTEMAEVEAALSRSPALAKRVARIKQTRERAAAAFDDTLTQPLAPEILKAAGGAAAPNPRPSLLWISIALAIMAVGIFIGRVSVPSTLSPNSPHLVIATSRGNYAGPELTKFLDTAESGQQMQLGSNIPAHIILTFAVRGGGACRQFEVGLEKSLMSGVACREADDWRIEVLARHDSEADSPAGTPAPEPINVMIDSMIEGAPYEAEQERAIIAARWK
jgi:hypothetical protein